MIRSFQIIQKKRTTNKRTMAKTTISETIRDKNETHLFEYEMCHKNKIMNYKGFAKRS